MDKGDLVPDEVVVAHHRRAPRPARLQGWRHPRRLPAHLAQAAALDKVLAEKKRKLDAVIELKVDDNQLIQRIVGRFTCAKCGEGYHDRFKRPKVRGMCDVCQSTEFTRRPDDTAETVNKRLMVYYRETAPLIGYYFCKGNLRTVDGMAPIDQVAKEIDRCWPRSNEERHACADRGIGRG